MLGLEALRSVWGIVVGQLFYVLLSLPFWVALSYGLSGLRRRESSPDAQRVFLPTQDYSEFPYSLERLARVLSEDGGPSPVRESAVTHPLEEEVGRL